MAQNPTHLETVLVEQSDDRLAKVEEAKRTGNAFQSSGSKGGEVVPHAIANQIAEDNSAQDTAVFRGRTVAAHRKDYIERVLNEEGFVEASNIEKADAHHRYSANLVREREAKNLEDAARLRSGEDIAAQRRAENQKLADDYAKAAAAYALSRQAHLDGAKPLYDRVAEIVSNVDASQLFSKTLQEQARQLSQYVTVPVALERPAEEALMTKDAIIATEQPFEAHAEGGVVTDYAQRRAQVQEANSNEVEIPVETNETQEAKPQEAVAADVANPVTAEVNEGMDVEETPSIIGNPVVGFIDSQVPSVEASEEEKDLQAQSVPSSEGAERKKREPSERQEAKLREKRDRELAQEREKAEKEVQKQAEAQARQERENAKGQADRAKEVQARVNERNSDRTPNPNKPEPNPKKK